jgi:hypothetical protein
VLADCAYFRLEEVALATGELPVPLPGTCAVVTCLEGDAEIRTSGGRASLPVSRTVLVPAAAEQFVVEVDAPTRILIATPVLA